MREGGRGEGEAGLFGGVERNSAIARLAFRAAWRFVFGASQSKPRDYYYYYYFKKVERTRSLRTGTLPPRELLLDHGPWGYMYLSISHGSSACE